MILLVVNYWNFSVVKDHRTKGGIERIVLVVGDFRVGILSYLLEWEEGVLSC